VNGAFPFVTFEIALPLLPPLHETFPVLLAMITGGVSADTDSVAVVEHPFASVSVTV
jgi:hypothetical protein